jgi:acyl-coenzyme A thioesterase PaaI-like protein
VPDAVAGAAPVMSGERPVDDGHCFACGPKSEHGLHLRFKQLSDGSVEARTTLAQPFQGWRGIAHGGIVAMLLDEAMAHAAGAKGFMGMTGELKLRFRKAVPIGEPIVVRGDVRWQRRNVLNVGASIALDGGDELAGGEGSFVIKGELPKGELLGEIGVGG